MSSYRSGLIGRFLFEKKSAIAYNVLWCFVIMVISFAMYMTCRQYMYDNDYYEIVSIYKGCENGYLNFDESKFELPKETSQNVKIDVLLFKVPKNAEVKLKISKATNELIEVQYCNEVVYQKSIVTKTIIVLVCFFGIAMIAFCTLMLVATNVKNPKGKMLRKLYRSLCFNK